MTLKHSSAPFIFSIDGLPGSGKTSLLNEILAHFKEKHPCLRVHVVHEPIDEWVKNGIFKAYCEDPKQHAASFQMNATVSRVENMKKAVNEYYRRPGAIDIIIGERLSPASDRAFAQTQFDLGNISPTAWSVYDKIWNSWAINSCSQDIKPTVIYYVATSMKQSLINIRSRNRDGEEGFTEEYLNMLDVQHQQLLTPINTGSAIRHVYWEAEYWKTTASTLVDHMCAMIHREIKVERLFSLYPALTDLAVLSTRRNQCITGSVSDSICSNSNFQSMDELLSNKTIGHRYREFPATAYGKRFESTARNRFIETTDGCTSCYDYDFFMHPKYKWIGASVDGMVILDKPIADDIPAGEYILEIKCPYSREITHEIPKYYYGQVQLYMAASGIHQCLFVQYKPALVKGRPSPIRPEVTVRVPKPEIIDVLRVPFDEDFINLWMPHWWSFWNRIILWRETDEGRIRRAYQVITEFWHAHKQKRAYCSPLHKAAACRYSKQYHRDIGIARRQPPITYPCNQYCAVDQSDIYIQVTPMKRMKRRS